MRPQRRLARLPSPSSAAYRGWCALQERPSASCRAPWPRSAGSGRLSLEERQRAAAGGIVAVLLAGSLSGWWQRHQVEQLVEQRAALVGEVAELQVQAEDWAKRGGRAKLERCGERERLCVRVDKTVGYGKDGDYFVLRGTDGGSAVALRRSPRSAIYPTNGLGITSWKSISAIEL